MKGKIIRTGYTTQKDTKRKHRDFIARALEKEPKLLLELLEVGKGDINGIKSPMGLSRILDQMQYDGIVDQSATKKDSRGIVRKAYTLTKLGKNYAEGIWVLTLDLDRFKEKNSSYRHYAAPERTWLYSDDVKAPVGIDAIEYPSTLSNLVNTANLQIELANTFTAELKKALSKTRQVPPDSELLISLKVNLSDFIEYMDKEAKQ